MKKIGYNVDLMKSMRQNVIMKCAYLYERPVKEGADMGAEKTFVDFKATNRAELHTLFDGGLRRGDTLLLRARADLGRSTDATRHLARLEEMGVRVEIIPAADNTKLTGRPAKAEIDSLQQFDHICSLWTSPLPEKHVCERVGEIVNRKIDRGWINYRCGPRDGSKLKAKRKAMEKRLFSKESRGDT